MDIDKHVSYSLKDLEVKKYLDELFSSKINLPKSYLIDMVRYN
jgi:hypothetical protein